MYFNMDSVDRFAKWYWWFQEGIVATIAGCVEDLRVKGLTIPVLKVCAMRACDENTSVTEREQKCRSNFQRTVLKALDEQMVVFIPGPHTLFRVSSFCDKCVHETVELCSIF